MISGRNSPIVLPQSRGSVTSHSPLSVARTSYSPPKRSIISPPNRPSAPVMSILRRRMLFPDPPDPLQGKKDLVARFVGPRLAASDQSDAPAIAAGIQGQRGRALGQLVVLQGIAHVGLHSQEPERSDRDEAVDLLRELARPPVFGQHATLPRLSPLPSDGRGGESFILCIVQRLSRQGPFRRGAHTEPGINVGRRFPQPGRPSRSQVDLIPQEADEG